MTYLNFFGNNKIYWAHYFKGTVLLKVAGKVEDATELQTLLFSAAFLDWVNKNNS